MRTIAAIAAVADGYGSMTTSVSIKSPGKPMSFDSALKLREKRSRVQVEPVGPVLAVPGDVPFERARTCRIWHGGGEVNVAYTDQLTVTGGTSPFTWSVASGTLPPGVESPTLAATLEPFDGDGAARLRAAELEHDYPVADAQHQSHVVVDQQGGLTAVGETPVGEGLKDVRFRQTRPLPSYLVAFGVGPFEITEARAATVRTTSIT